MRIVRFCLLPLLMHLISGLPVSGQTLLLDYGQYSGYSLRTGFVGNEFSKPLAACIQGTPELQEAERTQVKISIVRTNDQYSKALNLDHRANVTVLGLGEAESEAHYRRSSTSAETNLRIIVEVSGERNFKTLNDVEWQPTYAATMESGDEKRIEDLRIRCGDRYIKTVFYGVKLYAVLTVSDRHATELTALSGRLKGNVGIDLITAEQELGGAYTLQRANSAGAIKADTYAEGMDGLLVTAQLLQMSPTDGLREIVAKLKTALTSNRVAVHPFKYQIAAMPGFPSDALGDERLFESLGELKDLYQLTKHHIRDIKGLLTTDPRRSLLKESWFDNLRGLLKEHEDFLDAVIDSHIACRKAITYRSCREAQRNLSMPPPPPGIPPITPVGLQPFSIVTGRPTPVPSVDFIMNQQSLLSAVTATSNAELALVMSQIPSWYVAYLTIGSMDVSGTRKDGYGVILAQDLGWPAEVRLPEGGEPSAALVLMRALKHVPCVVKTQNHFLQGSYRYLDAEKCLTGAGDALRQAAELKLAEIANEDIAPHVRDMRFDGWFEANIYDCWGMPHPSKLAGYMVFVRQTSDRRRASISVFIDVGTQTVPILYYEEDRPRPEWAAKAASLRNANTYRDVPLPSRACAKR